MNHTKKIERLLKRYSKAVIEASWLPIWQLGKNKLTVRSQKRADELEAAGLTLREYLHELAAKADEYTKRFQK